MFHRIGSLDKSTLLTVKLCVHIVPWKRPSHIPSLRSPDTFLEEVLRVTLEGGNKGIGRPQWRLYDIVKAYLLGENIHVDVRK